MTNGNRNTYSYTVKLKVNVTGSHTQSHSVTLIGYCLFNWGTCRFVHKMVGITQYVHKVLYT